MAVAALLVLISAVLLAGAYHWALADWQTALQSMPKTTRIDKSRGGFPRG